MIIILVGKCASGKSTLARSLARSGYKRIITYTTRPKRNGEKNGQDYWFWSDNLFEDEKSKGFFAETAEYNTVEGVWKYGSSIGSYITNEDSVIVLNPIGVEQLLENCEKLKLDRKNLEIVYLDLPEEDLTARALSRGDKPEEINRRFIEDAPIFQHFEVSKDYDFRLLTEEACADYYLLKKRHKEAER